MIGQSIRPLRSVDDYNEAKAALKESRGRIRSNCYLGSRAIQKVAERGMSFIDSSDGCFFIYEDEGAYCRLHYFIAEGAPFPPVRASKPVVLEELDAGERNAPRIAALESELRTLGWRLLARNLQVSTSLQGREEELADALSSARERLSELGLSFGEGDATRKGQVIDLWRDYLKPTDVPTSHQSFISDGSQHVVCVVDAHNTVCGANWWQLTGATCETRHTVTAPSHYRRGIGSAMLLAVLHDAARAGCNRAYTYIDERNFRSLKLYEKTGFSPNGKTCTQFILE